MNWSIATNFTSMKKEKNLVASIFCLQSFFSSIKWIDGVDITKKSIISNALHEFSDGFRSNARLIHSCWEHAIEWCHGEIRNCWNWVELLLESSKHAKLWKKSNEKKSGRKQNEMVTR